MAFRFDRHSKSRHYYEVNIYVIRHGQTTGDVENRYGGAYDDGLSPEGVLQGSELAEILKDKGIQSIYSSSYIRAKDTAALLAEKIQCEVQVLPELRERNQYGHLTGMLKSEAIEKFPADVELLKDKMDTLVDAESYEDFKNRISAAFAKVVSDRDHSTIAVVWHGDPMRVLFRDILKWGELDEIGNCCYVELEKTDDGFVWKEAKGIVPSFNV